MSPSTLMDFLLGFMDLENISYIFNVLVLACGAPESLLAGFSSLGELAFWAQLFEGRLALNLGLNLTRVSISFV